MDVSFMEGFKLHYQELTDAAWQTPPTDKQKYILQKHGAEIPRTRKQASDLIEYLPKLGHIYKTARFEPVQGYSPDSWTSPATFTFTFDEELI